MRRRAVLLTVILFAGVLSLFGGAGQAQEALAEWAKQQISERTGIDPKLLATLFVTEGSDQFILAFVYVTEQVLESQLKAELKQAIAPFVGQKAMLALVVPTRRSQFNPLELSFSQDGLIHLVGSSQVHPVTEDFRAGQLEANAVSAGVIQLPAGLDISRPFQIHYRAHSTTFSLSGQAASGANTSPSPGFLFFLLQLLLLFFLFPFLIGI